MARTARAPLVTGIILAILIGGLLASSPATFVGRGATFIDTDAWVSRGGEVPVKTEAYLRSTDDMADFPRSFEQWNMTADLTDQWRGVGEFFKADAMISRYYTARGLYLPLHLFIIDSKYTRVLHSLEVSYGLQGMKEESQHVILLDVTSEDWISEDSPNQRIPVREMTFVKANASTGEVLERRLTHFFWVKREAWGVTNHLTWIGTNMQVPTSGNIDPHRRLLANFTSDVVAQIFVPDTSDVAGTVAEALVEDPPLGPILLAGSIAVPLGLVGYGIAAGRSRARAGDRTTR